MIAETYCFGILFAGIFLFGGCGDNGMRIGDVTDGIVRAAVPNPEISITINESVWGGYWIQLHNRSNERMVARINTTRANGQRTKIVSFSIAPNGTADADWDSMNGWTFKSGESGSISVDGFSKKLYFKIEGSQYSTWYDF